jgi:excisionase family DNA binding protein
VKVAYAELPPRAAHGMKEASHILSISCRKLYKEVAAGRIQSLKCGRRRLIPASAIPAYLETLAQDAGQYSGQKTAPND